MATAIQTITVPCKGQIKGDDVNGLFLKVSNLSLSDRKLIQAARSSVSKEWFCFMQHAEVILRFDERNLQVKLQCGKRTNRLVVQYNHKEEVEQIWEEVGWIMWARDVCMQAYEVVAKLAPSLLGLLQPALKLMITDGIEDTFEDMATAIQTITVQQETGNAAKFETSHINFDGVGHTQNNTPQIVKQSNCVPLKSEICSDLGYTFTSFPNTFGDEDQAEVEKRLQRHSQLIQSDCNVNLKFFVCATHFPMCVQNSQDARILPCKWVCSHLVRKCKTLIKQLIWPSDFQCSQFPSDNCMEAPISVSGESSRIIESGQDMKGEPNHGTVDIILPKDSVPIKSDGSEIAIDWLQSKPSVVIEDPDANSSNDVTISEDGIIVEQPTGEDSISIDTAFTQTCEPIKVKMCHGVGYSHTALPNIAGSKSQSQAETELKIFHPILDSNNHCHKHLRTFLCSAYLPACSEGLIHRVTACKTLCRSVQNRCGPLLEWLSDFSGELGDEDRPRPWPHYLNCDKFPDVDCISGGSDVDIGNKSVAIGSYTIAAVKPTTHTELITTTPPKMMCNPIPSDLCGGLGYSRTLMPNVVGSEHPRDAERAFRWMKPLLELHCHKDLRFFLCSAFFPSCEDGFATPVTSCRPVCRNVRKACIKQLRASGLDWPKQLKCSRFPRFEMCMEPPVSVPKFIPKLPTTPMLPTSSNPKATHSGHVFENKDDSSTGITQTAGGHNARYSGSSMPLATLNNYMITCLNILFLISYFS